MTNIVLLIFWIFIRNVGMFMIVGYACSVRVFIWSRRSSTTKYAEVP